jgi:hypothetical protein
LKISAKYAKYVCSVVLPTTAVVSPFTISMWYGYHYPIIKHQMLWYNVINFSETTCSSVDNPDHYCINISAYYFISLLV